MTIVINFDDLDEATVTALKSDAVQKAIADAFESAEKPLRDKRDSLLGEKKDLEKQLKEVNDLGGLEALKKVPEIKDDVTKKTKAEESYAEQVKVLQTQLDDMKSQNVNSKLQERLSREIREAKGSPELLEHHIKTRIQHTLDENGNLKITVLDKNGVEMFTNGKEASVSDLLNEFKSNSTFQRAFEAPQLNGGGTKPSGTVNTLANPFASATLNATEQGRLVKSDRPKAVQLANAAGVKIAGLNA